jgi:hypothetical protein
MPLEFTAADPDIPANQNTRCDLKIRHGIRLAAPRRAAPAKQSRTRKRCLNSRRPGSSSTSAGVSMLRDNSCETLAYRPFHTHASQGRRTIRSVVACSNEKNNAALDRQTAVLDRASLIVRSTTPESYAPWEMTSGFSGEYSGTRLSLTGPSAGMKI